MILGVDPGATSGWALYDPSKRCVVDAGQFPDHHVSMPIFGGSGIATIVVERPKGQGPTRPQVVECGITFGRLMAWFEMSYARGCVHEMLRLEVKQILSSATHGEVHVKNDSTAWAALRLLHGEGSDKKARVKKGQVIEPAGAIGNVKSHERAALAVAVAFAIREGVTC